MITICLYGIYFDYVKDDLNFLICNKYFTTNSDFETIDGNNIEDLSFDELDENTNIYKSSYEYWNIIDELNEKIKKIDSRFVCIGNNGGNEKTHLTNLEDSKMNNFYIYIGLILSHCSDDENMEDFIDFNVLSKSNKLCNDFFNKLELSKKNIGLHIFNCKV